MRIRACGKIIYWLAFLIVVGMGQFYITKFYHYFVVPGESESAEFFLNGFFLFLCISTIAGICFEFFVDNTIRLPKYLTFTLACCTFLIIIFAMGLYSVTYTRAFPSILKLRNSDFVYYQYLLLSVSVTESFLLKYLIYHNQEINNTP